MPHAPTNPADITALLQQSGDDDALYCAVYTELKALARARLARESRANSLSPTVLVNDVYLRLAGSNQQFENRRHFFAAAAQAMRRVLIDAARKRRSRGQSVTTVTVDSAMVLRSDDELLALDEALTRLESNDAALATIVKLRFFAGLSIPDTAAALMLSPRTVDRRWQAARAWLLSELEA